MRMYQNTLLLQNLPLDGGTHIIGIMTINNHLSGLIVAVIIVPQSLAADTVKAVEQAAVESESASDYVLASQVVSFEISGMSLDEALNAFIEVTDWQIGFSSALTKGIKGRAVKGQYSPEQALEMLLESTGLTYRMTGDGIVIIEPESAEFPEPQIPDVDIKPSNPILRPLMLKEMTVTGKSKRRDKQSYSAIYTSSATRTHTPIQEMPQSIQVITPALIADQQNKTISESLRNVSGVITNNPLLTPNFEWTLVRGFRAEQLLDGFTQYYNPGDRESTVNIERIEVLKGPNALLYGGGSGSPAGGLINLVSKLPHPEASGEVGINVHTHQFYQPFFDINLPINNNILFRITGE